MPGWDDRQYLKFADERTRAARELLARVRVVAPTSVIDLGCGPGNSTVLLRERWPNAELVGVDTSDEMLARARRDLPDIRFVAASAQDFVPLGPVDVWFANALMQWVPAHEALLVRLLSQLAPGGAIAMQVPCNLEEPSHRLMREVPGPWAAAIGQVRDRARVGPATAYYDLLAPHAARVDLWQTTYEHVMDDADAIVEWLKGTGLRPYLEALAPDMRAAYLEAYTRALGDAYPVRADGKRLFSFPRLFLVATQRG